MSEEKGKGGLELCGFCGISMFFMFTVSTTRAERVKHEANPVFKVYMRGNVFHALNVKCETGLLSLWELFSSLQWS